MLAGTGPKELVCSLLAYHNLSYTVWQDMQILTLTEALSTLREWVMERFRVCGALPRERCWDSELF